jgi:hypothetical protein
VSKWYFHLYWIRRSETTYRVVDLFVTKPDAITVINHW